MGDVVTNWLAGGQTEDVAALRFEFGVMPFAPAVLLIALAAALSFVSWWYFLRKVRTRRRFTLATLRSVALALIVFLILDPTIVGQKLEPSDHYLAVIYDDSESMQIIGPDKKSRAERMKAATSQDEVTFEQSLTRTHQVAKFRAGERLERLRSMDDLRFAQHESDLIGGVREALRELEGVNVSGAIVFSDGIQQSGDASARPEDLETEVPVFTVGTGVESDWRDLAITNMTVTRTNFDKSPVSLTVDTHAQGLEGHDLIVEVLDEERVIREKKLPIGSDDDEHQVTLEFVPEKRDWIAYQARVRLGDTGPTGRARAVEKIRLASLDSVIENNTRRFLVDNREREYRVLYFSGRPNWENKFLSRALSEDEQLALSSLIRISGAERKFEYRGKESSMTNPLFEGFDESEVSAPRYDEAVFIRLGLNEGELQDGYPLDADDLFAFDLVIWGDIEHGFFSQGHLEVTRDFVSKRGGAFMMMGGPRAFAAGDYDGSLIEPMLPVMLGPDGGDWDELSTVQVKPKPTVEGYLSGMWTLRNDIEQNMDEWLSLPSLYGVNLFSMIRAGGTVWARMEANVEDVAGEPLFVWQRYGEGMVAVLATGETWPWQMQTALEDDSHERFWRQTVRALIKDVPEQVTILTNHDGTTVDEEEAIAFLVRDKLFDAREGLNVTVNATEPDGDTVALPVEESLETPGKYTAYLEPGEAGLYRLELTAIDRQDQSVAGKEMAVIARPDNREFERPQYDPVFLQRMAETTGGAFFTLDDLDALVDAIPLPEGESVSHVRFHMWHWPPFFFIAAVLLISEWYLRRRAGQP